MSAATAGKPGRRAGATAGQWSLVAAPPHVAGRSVSRQRAGRAVPGRVPAPPRQRTGSAAPGRRVAAVPGPRVRAMAPGQSALTMPERTAGPVNGQRGRVVPGRWDNTADRRGRPGAARPHRPALAVVPPQPAAEEERPEALAPVRKPEMGVDEWERRAPQRPAQARRVRARPRTRLTRRGRLRPPLLSGRLRRHHRQGRTVRPRHPRPATPVRSVIPPPRHELAALPLHWPSRRLWHCQHRLPRRHRPHLLARHRHNAPSGRS